MPTDPNVLLVEDNPMDVELVLNAFREAGLQNHIRVARNGREALNILLRQGQHADQSKEHMPDLVLLDLRLPGVDGHEVLRQVKNTPIVRRIPIVVLTSSAEEGDRVLSYDLGANSYIVKPVLFADLLQLAQQVKDYWLGLNEPPPLVGNA